MYTLNDSQTNELFEKCGIKITEKTNDNIVKNYIQKIINLTDNNYFIWIQPNPYHKVYQCNHLNHILKFECYAKYSYCLIADDIRYDNTTNGNEILLQSLFLSITEQINDVNNKKFIEKLSFLDKI